MFVAENIKKKNIEKTTEELEKLTPNELDAYKTELKAHQDKATETKISDAIKAYKDEAKKDLQKALETLEENVGKEIANQIAEMTKLDLNVENQVEKFLNENADKIKSLKTSGSGVVEFQVKAVGTMTTGSATNPDGIPELVGSQIAQPSNVNLRESFVDSLVSNVDTSLASYPDTETLPKEGNFDFIGEGAVKPDTDFKIETRYANPKKIAAWIKLTDESIKDIPGLQSIATDLLRKKHDLKKQNGLLFGDGVGANPKGATAYGRTFVAGDMALAVTNPNIMDVINASITDIYSTHNYEDEMSYLPSLVVLNPTDFFIQFVSAKNSDGNPLYPTASLFNRVNIGGLTIIPERSIPAGKIFVADMSKYNTTNYIGYTVKIGYVNDDFIRNQFVILGESRFHAFVKKLDEQAFIYDDITTIKNAITQA
mgnify:CR=1 FL=1